MNLWIILIWLMGGILTLIMECRVCTKEEAYDDICFPLILLLVGTGWLGFTLCLYANREIINFNKIFYPIVKIARIGLDSPKEKKEKKRKLEDYYLNTRHAYKRLEEEFIKYGKLIIAVDYDDTIFDFHGKERTYNDVIKLIRRWSPYAQIIIWTGRSSDDKKDIEDYLHYNNIPYYGINVSGTVPSGSRKIYANVYLDDRAGLRETYDILLELIEKIEDGTVQHV